MASGARIDPWISAGAAPVDALSHDGKERIITVPAPNFPGGQMLMGSKTYNPDFLKAIGDRWAGDASSSDPTG